MTTLPHPGRWTRWAIALGVVLGLGITTPPDATAEARHRKPHRPALVATHGRAQPVVVRKRGRLAPPAIEQVAIGPLALANPVMLASGTCGYGIEMTPHGDIDGLTHGSTRMVKVRRHIRELHKVLKISDRGIATTLIEIVNKR